MSSGIYWWFGGSSPSMSRSIVGKTTSTLAHLFVFCPGAFSVEAEDIAEDSTSGIKEQTIITGVILGAHS